MDITVNGELFNIPFSTDEIKLSDFLNWQKDFGRELNKELSTILERKGTAEEDQLIEIEDYLDKEALYWFCFWTNTEYVDAKTQPNIIPFLNNYRVLRSLFNEPFDFPYEVEWKGETWQISDFKVNPSAEMSFNEIITSKEVMRQVFKIGEDNWTGIKYLCAVFLRKKGEPFIDEFIVEDRGRMNSFNDLPLRHALAVAFFLNICVNMWSKTLASFQKTEEPAAVNQS